MTSHSLRVAKGDMWESQTGNWEEGRVKMQPVFYWVNKKRKEVYKSCGLCVYKH